MKEDRISKTQLTALVWAGALAPAAELMPGLLLPGAGRGAWLAALAAGPVVLLAGWLTLRAAGEAGLSRAALELAGPALGRGVLLIYMAWGELLLALRLRLCADRLLDAGERDGSLTFFLLGAAAVALWMGAGELSAFARAGQLFLTALLCGAAVVLGLAVPHMRPERLVLYGGWDAGGTLRAALSAAGALSWVLPAGFLTGRTERKGRWHWTFWAMGGCALLALAQAVIVGCFGAELAGRLDRPFFALAKSVGIEGAFQRAEALAAALWTLADLVMAGALVFALREMTGAVFPKADVRAVGAAAVLAAAVLALAAFPAWGTAEDWNRTLVPAAGPALALLLPGGLCLLRAVRGKWR